MGAANGPRCPAQPVARISAQISPPACQQLQARSCCYRNLAWPPEVWVPKEGPRGAPSFKVPERSWGLSFPRGHERVSRSWHTLHRALCSRSFHSALLDVRSMLSCSFCSKHCLAQSWACALQRALGNHVPVPRRPVSPLPALPTAPATPGTLIDSQPAPATAPMPDFSAPTLHLWVSPSSRESL